MIQMNQSFASTVSFPDPARNAHMTQFPDTRIFTRSDVLHLLDLHACIAAVEQPFRLHALGAAPAPAVLGMHVGEGGFHVKAGVLTTDRAWFAAKVNANFPGNPERRGLPTIQGALLLYDAGSGVLLAIMDSQALTVLRTAAATGVAAKYLARPESDTASLVGCGAQASTQLAAWSRVRQFRRVLVFETDGARAHACANEASQALGLPVEVALDVGS